MFLLVSCRLRYLVDVVLMLTTLLETFAAMILVYLWTWDCLLSTKKAFSRKRCKAILPGGGLDDMMRR